MSVQSELCAIAATLDSIGKSPIAKLIAALAGLLKGRETKEVEVLLQTLLLNDPGHVDAQSIRAQVDERLRQKFGDPLADNVSRLAEARGLAWLNNHLARLE